MTNLTKFVALSAVALTISCGKTEEKAPNDILLKNAPETKAYKEELTARLQRADPGNLEYYFDHYTQKDGKEYLYITIEGDVEATAVITVTRWDEKLKAIRESKGTGYRGAEFVNLQLETERDAANTSLVYKGMDDVID